MIPAGVIQTMPLWKCDMSCHNPDCLLSNLSFPEKCPRQAHQLPLTHRQVFPSLTHLQYKSDKYRGTYNGTHFKVMIDIEGSLNYFSAFAYRGSSLRRKKSAARHEIGMVWLYSLAYIPVRRMGVFYSFKLLLPAFTALTEGGGGSAPCMWHTCILSL